ncbi:MAG: 30S ribosomal protein S16 [Alphaproteobacteria bacterium]|nr:30S ribosomal protein S16 [Alphaproteobacteria bacterium]
MAVMIRLARGGTKKRPYYRIVVADKRSARDGDFIEKVGAYNPLLAKDAKERLVLNEDRIKHWLSVGAQPSETLARFLTKAGLYSVKPRYEIKAKGSRLKKKAAEAAAKAAEAASAPAEAPAADNAAA